MHLHNQPIKIHCLSTSYFFFITRLKKHKKKKNYNLRNQFPI